MKDTFDLLKASPHYYGSSMAHSSAVNARPYKITIVLCQPRSGSSLLLRLMNMACMTHMIGDRPQSFYEGQLQMYDSLGKGIYGHPITLEEEGIFPDEYRGTSPERERYIFRYVMALNFGDGHHASGYMKSTIIGFGNNLVAPFVQMIRDLYSGSEYQLTIAYLTRDTEEIIRSFQTREGPGKEMANKNPQVARTLVENQLKQFKQDRDLDDVWITYDQLIQDPCKVLKKLNPLYSPNESAVKRIMSNIIR